MSLATTALSLGGPVIKTALDLLLPVVHDVLGGGEVADKAIRQIKYKALEIDGTRIIEASKNIRAEIESESWLARNWRPITMLTFAGLLVYQVIFVSLINAIFGQDTIVVDREIIMSILDIIYFGLGGFVLARSGEKAIRTYTEHRSRVMETIKDEGPAPKPVPPGATVEEVPFMKRDAPQK